MIILANKIYYAPTDEMVVPIYMEEKLINRVLSVEKEMEIGIEVNAEEDTKVIKEEVLASIARLIVPSLKINAKIQNVGITKKGNMSTPNNFFDVGLYKYGPSPGDIGSAVISGHVENGLGFKAVFGNLKEIKEGDDI